VRTARLRRRNGVVVAVALGALGCTGAALAADRVASGSYSGSLIPASRDIVVSFKVSAGGKRVTGLTTNNMPLYCEGGGPAVPIHFASAAISKQGTFTSTGKYVIAIGPLKGQLGTKLKLTGKFGKDGSEQGTLTTTYIKTPKCSGKSSYSTKRA
jgi:hypothetical protein